MPGRAVSLSRLRSYEEICRQGATTEADESVRAELSKFADTVHQIASDLAASPEAGVDSKLFSR